MKLFKDELFVIGCLGLSAPEFTMYVLKNIATLITQIEMARRHGLEKLSHVIVEERQNGIFIKSWSSRK